MQSSSLPAGQSRSGCATLFPRLVMGLILLLVILIALGFLYETQARAADLSRVTPLGQLVDVGGHRLHLVCTGEKQEGQPTVVLESGVGGWSMHWHTFQQEVAQLARVCAYDRAGYGWSEPGPTPRDGERIAAELRTLLENAGESGPYLLVGASRGGQYARLFRAAYPDEVVGMVLVDAEPEDLRFRSAYVKNTAAQNQTIFSALRTLTRLGVFRVLGGDPAQVPAFPCLPSLVSHLPAELHDAYLAVEGQPACYDTLLAEEAATEQREAQVRRSGEMGDLPLVVLTRSTATDLPPEVAEVETIWQELQQATAALSTQGRLVQATASGHDIQLEEPALVLDAIRSLLQ